MSQNVGIVNGKGKATNACVTSLNSSGSPPLSGCSRRALEKKQGVSETEGIQEEWGDFLR